MSDHTERHGYVAAACFAANAGIVLGIALVTLPGWTLTAAMMSAGFLSGVIAPSRDMLVRAATPKGSEGRVFGFVYSGLDLGALIAPPVIGSMLDHGAHHAPFLFIAATLLASLAPAFFVARRA